MTSTTQKISDMLTNRVIYSAVLSPQGSKSFVKKILPISLAYIMHQRTNIDREEFDTRMFDGTTYVSFKKNLNNLVLKEISEWSVGAIDALDKDYLRELYLIFADRNNSNTILESYKFQFKYMAKDHISYITPPTKTDLQEATKSLLNQIESLNQFSILELGTFGMQVALTFYDDVTPLGYEPPFFNDRDDNGNEVLKCLSNFSKNYVQLGCVGTGFNVVRCRAKGDVFALSLSTSSKITLNDNVNNNVTEEPIPSTTDDPLQSELDSCFNLDHDNNDVIDNRSLRSSQEYTEKHFNSDIDTSDSTINLFNMDENETSDRLRCYCGIMLKFEEIDLMKCINCFDLDHACCAGYLNSTSGPIAYKCGPCSSDSMATPSQLSHKRLLAVYRYHPNMDKIQKTLDSLFFCNTVLLKKSLPDSIDLTCDDDDEDYNLTNSPKKPKLI